MAITVKNKTTQEKVIEDEKKIEYTSIRTYKLGNKKIRKRIKEKNRTAK